MRKPIFSPRLCARLRGCKMESNCPLSRGSFLALISENGGKAEGLDLTQQTFDEGIDLSGLDLSRINLSNKLLNHAKFNGSNLFAADFTDSNLEYAEFNAAILEGVFFNSAFLSYTEFREADLSCAEFQKSQNRPYAAALKNTDFRKANLFKANFQGSYFYGTKLQGANIRGADIEKAHLEEADWGNYVIGEETKKDFTTAEHYYRILKVWYTTAGYYNIAGTFFFREMTCKRKTLSWQPNPIPRLWSKLVSIMCGYGEKPLRVVISGLAIILSLALIYYFIGTFSPNSFLDSLYFSAVSFTAVGYGSWVKEAVGWVKWLGVSETILGVFMMALFLVTFTRQMTR